MPAARSHLMETAPDFSDLDLRGYPPYRMQADEAAYYCGMSVTSFRRAVDSGELPGGVKATGGRFWLRHELEAAMVNADPAPAHNFGQKI